MNRDSRLKHDRFIISVSYGDCNGDLGGTSKVVLAHREMLDRAGISQLHIYPRFIRLPGTSRTLLNLWGVTKDGQTHVPVYNDSEIIQIIGREIEQGSRLLETHVHHLLNIDIGRLESILNTFTVPIKFYLHDYYSICPQFNLLKNNSYYCGEGGVNVVKCLGCSMYNSAVTHYKHMQDFLSRFEGRLEFIAPSDVVKKIWSSAYDNYKKQVHVVYHQKRIGQYDGNCELISETSPVRVAFVGGQYTNKGWDKWEQASAKAYSKCCNLLFYHFGKTADTIPYIQKVPVAFSRGNLNAMVIALRTHKIDVAILWSICPETYSYTYFESMASNVFVITNVNSGNIAAMVELHHNGIVLVNEGELSDLLCNEARLRKMINDFKRTQPKGPAELVENDEILSMITKVSVSPSAVPLMAFDTRSSILKRILLTMLFELYRIVKMTWHGLNRELQRAKLLTRIRFTNILGLNGSVIPMSYDPDKDAEI